MDAVWGDYEKKHRKTLPWAEARWERHLKPHLGMLLAATVGKRFLFFFLDLSHVNVVQ
jgi:hypothetical protein